MINHLRHRPPLLVGLVVAMLAAVLAAMRLGPVAAFLVGWDAGVVGYGTCYLLLLRRNTADRLEHVARLLDAGRWLMLVLTVGAAIASLAAIVTELARHHSAHGGWRVALAGGTVVLSWIFVHMVFATHYAHEFWRRRGLSFPGNDRPAMDEFLYFSFCLGVASQVSDVSTQSAGMRRLVLAHSLVSYLFNTAIIALGVNVAASLAG